MKRPKTQATLWIGRVYICHILNRIFFSQKQWLRPTYSYMLENKWGQNICFLSLFIKHHNSYAFSVANRADLRAQLHTMIKWLYSNVKTTKLIWKYHSFEENPVFSKPCCFVYKFPFCLTNPFGLITIGFTPVHHYPIHGVTMPWFDFNKCYTKMTGRQYLKE